MPSFSLEILTPDKPYFKGDVEGLVVKGSEGFLGILAHHAPLLARLAPGPLRIKKQDGEQILTVGAGTIEVAPAGVTILVDSAESTAKATADHTV